MSATRWLWIVVLLVGVTAAVWGGMGFPGLRAGGRAPHERDVVTRFSSPYLNTRPEARYVGARRCTQCHAAQHESYLKTAHAVAMADVALDQEPPDGQFLHAKSGRHYQIERRDGQLWHRESHVRPDGSEVELDEYPLRYVVGSGRFAKTYLVEVDGYLVESPVTWFGMRNSWGMSPGYDDVEHNAFHRMIVPECLYCHMGTFQTKDNSRYRFEFQEHAIGCERCHGPGSLHVEKWANSERPPANSSPAEEDLTIVNPRRLSRELSEAVCADCHQSGQASSRARGTALGDFRPGLRLEDFRHEYRFDVDYSHMTVTGHVEQLHLSRCYEAAESLTCITCHDPHDPPPPEQRVAANRAACLKCHAVPDGDACTVPLAKRRETSAENDCIQCHMPQVPTDLLHFAFTHHRIGIHTSDGEHRPAPVGSPLVPLADLSQLPQPEWERSRGLAYYDLYSKEAPFDARYRTYLDRAEDLLKMAYSAGITDPDVAVTLALIASERGHWAEAIERANAVLQSNGSQANRDDALFTLAQAYFQTRRYREAVGPLEQLVKVRRGTHEWFMLGICQQQLGKLDQAIAAFEQVERIDPGSGLTYRMLAPLYARQGQDEQAAQQLRRSQELPESGFPTSPAQ